MSKIFQYSLSFLIFVVLFSSCKKDEEEVYGDNILPSELSFNLPPSISSPVSKSDKTLSGDEIYNFMRAFIHTGNIGAEVVRTVVSAINQNHLDQPMNFTYVSNEDDREKFVTVTENKVFEGETYQYKLEMDDSGATCLQIYWNKSPVKGVTIVKPSVLNKNDIKNPNAVIRVDYSEAGNLYTREMTVSVSGLTTNSEDKLDKLKLFAGEKDGILELYGNANLPTATILDENHVGGYQWAFVAKSDRAKDISTVSVCLPVCSYETNVEILSEFSLINVLTSEINIIEPNATDEQVADFLVNTASPGYFSNNGFISCGDDVPNGFETDFIDLGTLLPYTPKEINDMEVSFFTSGK